MESCPAFKINSQEKCHHLKAKYPDIYLDRRLTWKLYIFSKWVQIELKSDQLN